MHFVDEDDGAGAVLPRAFGVGHHLLDFLDAGQHCGEFDEIGVRHARDDLGQRRLADTGRPPEDERAGIVALDLHAQRLARSEDVLLPNKLVERARTHAIGQRPRLVDGIVVLRGVLEQIHSVIHHGGTEPRSILGLNLTKSATCGGLQDESALTDSFSNSPLVPSVSLW